MRKERGEEWRFLLPRFSDKTSAVHVADFQQFH